MTIHSNSTTNIQESRSAASVRVGNSIFDRSSPLCMRAFTHNTYAPSFYFPVSLFSCVKFSPISGRRWTLRAPTGAPDVRGRDQRGRGACICTMNFTFSPPCAGGLALQRTRRSPDIIHVTRHTPKFFFFPLGFVESL